MRIYTKKGDEGTTSLYRGGSVPKHHIRVSAYGDVDELNATIGVAAAADPVDLEAQLLEDIQRDLFSIGTMLATATPESSSGNGKVSLPSARITELETAIDRITDAMPPLERFVLPGGSLKAAMLHNARTVCRRAERSLVALKQEDRVPESVLPYLNRLSDLLFTLARFANQQLGINDREW